MEDDKIKNEINEVVATSPSATAVNASKPIQAPASHSTLRTALPEDMPEAPAQQFNTTPERGIGFVEDTPEIVTTGVVLPNLDYDTTYQTPQTGGDPIYYEPNFQPVVPYPVNKNVESNTLNARKLAWNIAVTNYGAWDKDYTGYYLLPEQGSQSMWDFFVGSTMTFGQSLPATIAKGATNLAGSITKGVAAGAGLTSAAWEGVLSRVANEAPESDLGSLLNAIGEKYKEGTGNYISEINSIQNIVEEAVEPLERAAFETWDADVNEYDTLKSMFGRGIGSGVGSFALAAATKNPELAFTFLNFAEQNKMRRNALNYGVSPAWSEVYSIGGATVNSLLDMLQFEALINSAGLIKQGSTDYLNALTGGLARRIARHAKREGLATGFEMGTEMAQEAIEGAYDPEFRAHPTEVLLTAAVSAFALKAATLPFSVRAANKEERAKLAEQMGFVETLNDVEKAADSLVDKLVKEGAIDESQRGVVREDLIKTAPDYIIRTLREGVKGELDKIPAANRKEFMGLLKSAQANFGKDIFSPATFEKLDTETDNSLSGIRSGLSDAETEMIKGVVRGAYVLSAVANANNPDYAGFTIPTFEVTKSDNSSFAPKRNVISISATRSNTEYSNISPDFANLMRRGFLPSSSESDKMASILHEMSHWLDYSVGQTGFGDFLEHYYNSIADVFGKGKALSVYNASAKGESRIPRQRGIEYTSDKNATEYAAQAIARLGKRSAEYFGLGKSKANQFLSYANMMLNQLSKLQGKSGDSIQQAMENYQTALQEVIKANMDKLQDLIDYYGDEKIQNALAKFKEGNSGFDDFAEFLASQDMLRDLYDVVNSFADAAGIEKINKLFGGDQKAKENFVTAGDRMFKNGYDQAVAEVKLRRAEAKATKKPVDAKADPSAVKTDAGVVVTDPMAKLRNLIVSTGTEPTEAGEYNEIQDWAKSALGAKESVKQSHDAVKDDPKQISADVEIDGRNLSDDIKLAQDGLAVRLKNPMNKVVKWASSSEWGWGLDRILTTLLGRNASEKFDIQGKYSAKQTARSKYWNEFMDRLKPLFGEKTNKAGFVYKYKTMTTDLGLVRLKGVEIIDPRNTELSTKQDLTGWEAMYVYLMQRQGYGARIQKSTTTNINDIISVLSDEEKQFADAMSNQLMSMYEKTFGKVSYDNYFPIMDLEHELFNEISIDSLTSRMKTDDAIAIVDAGRIFSQYISRWASHESGYFQQMKRLRDVFMYKGVSKDETGPRYIFDPDVDEERIAQSASVAHATKTILGKRGYENIMNIINNQLSDGQEELFEVTRTSTLNQIGNNVLRTLLANKLVSFPKNLTNMFMMWGGAKDQSLYWNSFAEGFGNMGKTFDYMMAHSPEIKQRWGGAGGINEYLDQNTLGGSTAPVMKAISKAFSTMEWSADRTNNMAKFSAAMDMMGDAGLKLFMQSGDMVANVFGGYGLVKDYMAQGMSEDEAFKKLDRYIVEHQSSSNLTMKPMIQLRANKGFFSQFFAFTSEQVVKAASVLGTFDEVKMGTATKSQAISNAVSIAVSATLFSILASGAWDLFDDDDDVREEAEKAVLDSAIDQVLGGFVAGNSILTPAISALIGDSRMGGMRNPLYEYALDGITALKKGEYDRLVVKAMSANGVFVGADNAWNTMLGLSLLTDQDPQVRYAGRLMTAGYSASRAKKRSGVDVRKEIVENFSE